MNATDLDIGEYGFDDSDDFEPWEPPYEPNPITESILIDWHRASSFKKARAVAAILEPHIKNFEGVSRKSEVVRKHLRLAVLNLFVAWRCWKWLSYPADNNAYSKMHTRYNLLRINKQFPAIMRGLEAAGYVEIKTGFRDEQTGKGFQTRAKAADKLIELFAPIKPHMVGTCRYRESVLLTDDGVDENGEAKGRKWVDYESTPEAVRMRESLFAYNTLIHRSEISFPEELLYERVDLQRRFTYRIFNKGSFDAGGRFYGGWWVTLPKHTNPDGSKINMRQFIRINGNRVVELDYSAQHPTLLYARKGLPLPHDPYDIDGYERPVVKQAVLISLNAASRKGAKAALHKWARDEREKTGLENQFQISSSIMDDIERVHAPIAEYFYSSAWKFLQRQDSAIAERVMNHFTAKGIPVLMVHDSFIVEQQHEAELREVMSEAMALELRAYGQDLKPSIKKGW
ncbi:hypothetical protein [Azospirillum tabaci]|uniref:hypothetical protein n=1 Tax=Azospirillum tabaci TaxID=2752310 RepID=UPI0016603B5F|nr:hypothetical protein [Azospirillum tabaci]